MSFHPSGLTPNRALVVIVVLLGLIWVAWPTNTTSLSRWTGLAANGGNAALIGRGMPPAAIADEEIPWGNPLQNSNTVMTQGYGVGSHAPAAIWGGVDLAIGPNGQPTPQDTLGQPIYATHAGVIKMDPNSWPAGNHVWVLSTHYKSGYGHLQRYAPDLQDGMRVTRGQLIGFVGSTGQSSGPHLHYHIWKDGVNVNPMEYGALDGATNP